MFQSAKDGTRSRGYGALSSRLAADWNVVDVPNGGGAAESGHRSFAQPPIGTS